MSLIVREDFEPQRLAAQLKAALRRESALTDFSLFALRQSVARPLIERAAKLVAQALDAGLGTVLELEPDGEWLRIVAEHGAPTSTIGVRVSAHRDSQSGRAIAAYRSGDPGSRKVPPAVVIEDLAADPHLAQSIRVRELGMASSMCVVIPARERPFGVLAASSRQRRRFTADEQEFLQAVANVLSATLERVQAHAALAASEARFRRLTELSADWYWEQDADFRFTESSISAESRAGVAPGSLVGRRRWELEGVEPLSGSWDEHRAVLEAHHPFRDFEYLRVDDAGRAHYVSVSGEPVFDAQGSFSGYRGVARDITERKLAERALARSEQRYRLLFEASPLPIYVYDRETLRILAVNARMERQYGWSREELERMTMLELRPPVERAKAEASARGEIDPRTRRAWRHWRRGGEAFDVEVTAHDIELNGRPARLVTPVDVTERETTQRTLRDLADNLRSLSRRLVKAQEAERRVLARELHDRAGQNLTALAIHLHILREGVGRLEPEEVERRVREAAELTETTARMLDDVTAELRPPMLEEFGLGAALQWYAEQQATLTGLAIEVRVSEPSPAAQGERDLAFFRIAQEALTNVVRHAHASRVGISLARTAEGLELVVRDNGRGLDAGTEQHTHSRLGLRTMRERAMAVGARLALEPAPGGGTLVRIVAP